jgi:hypothetical protein
MGFVRFLQWYENSAFSTTMRTSTWAEPIVETIHVLTLTLFLGFVVLLDLRLLGVGMRRRRASEVMQQINPCLVAGFAVMVVSGVLLFSGDPLPFYNSIFFKIKMIMLVFAGVNVWVFNLTAGRKVAQWDQDSLTPPRAKVAAIVSLVLWAAIVAAGRAIAYSLPPP